MEAFDIEKAIVAAFEEVRTTLQLLAKHIDDVLATLPLWVDNGLGGLVPERKKAIHALKHHKVNEELNPQETFACVGAIACSKWLSIA